MVVRSRGRVGGFGLGRVLSLHSSGWNSGSGSGSGSGSSSSPGGGWFLWVRPVLRSATSCNGGREPAKWCDDCALEAAKEEKWKPACSASFMGTLPGTEMSRARAAFASVWHVSSAIILSTQAAFRALEYGRRELTRIRAYG